MFQKNLSRVVLFSLLIQLFLPYQLSLTLVGGFPNVSIEKRSTQAAGPAGVEADMILWLDASDTSTLKTDEACTSGVSSDGQRIQCWQDKSGQNNHVTQSVIADSPFYRLNQQYSLPVLDFENATTGNDDVLFTSGSGQITPNGSYTKFVVFKYDTLTSSNNLISSLNTGSAFWGSASPSNGKLHTWNLGGVATSPGFLSHSTQLSTSQYYIGSTRYDNVASDGNLSVLNLDGTQIDSDDTVQNHTIAPIAIGNHLNSSLGGANGLDGKIAEALVYNRALSDSEIDDVECYLSQKWGISVSQSCTSFTVAPISLTIDENSGTGSFTVVLDTQPATDVVFTLMSQDINEAIISSGSLVFTSVDWNVPQTVIVAGVDDTAFGNDTTSVIVSVNDALSDDTFDILPDQTVNITLTNDDVFTPNSPTDFPNLVLWLDGDDSSTLFSNNTCSIAAADGNTIGCWQDKSGQNNHVTQSVVADRPVYNTNQINSKPVLTFVNATTGNDDRLHTNTSGQITANGSYTKFVVFKYNTLTAPNNLISSDTTGSAFWGSTSPNNGKLHTWNLVGPALNPGFLSQPIQLSTSQYYIGATRYDNVESDGNLSVLNLDGTQIDSDDTVQDHTSQPISIGGHGPANGLDGEIAEAIVYNGALTDAQIDCVEAYLGDKYGITVASAGSICTIPTSITLTKTNYPQYKVFQRDGSDQYDFTLSGAYNGACTAVEASFASGAYVTIDAAPAGGTFSGTLADQGIGQGRLSVRCANNISVEDGVDDIGIGDIYVVAGQSNAEGHAQNVQLYTTTAPTATVFPTVYTDGDVWKVGNDDTDPGGGAGSVWPILGGYIVENTGVPVMFITTADGGKGLVSPAHWKKGGGVNCAKGVPCYTNMLNQVGEANPNAVKAILWFQGETDASSGVSRTAYNAGLDQFIADAQNDLPGTPDLVPGIIGPWIPAAVNSTQIRLATMDAWDDNPSIKYGPQAYDIHISNDGIGDTVHYVADDEIQTLGYRWWKALEEHYYGGSDGRGPVVQSAELGVGNTTIEVTFTDNTLPLLSSGALSTQVWSVNNNGSALGVTGASITGTGTVTLTLASPASSTGVTLSYAKDNTGENQSVLTDSVAGNTALGTSPLPADPFTNFPVSQNMDAALLYTGGYYTESANNNGTLQGSLIVTLQNDTFVDPITLGTHLTVTGYTPGLAPVVTRNSSTQLTLSFSGVADVHRNSEDLNNVSLTFLNGAFTNNTTASSIAGYIKNNIVFDYSDVPLVSPTLTGMTLWLDGNDIDGDGIIEGSSEAGLVSGDVAIWTDKSGQNNSVTGTARPTLLTNGLNGKAVLDFASDSLVAPDADQITANTSYTKFVVFKRDVAGTNMNLISSTNPTGMAFWMPSSNKLANWHLNGSTSPGHNVSTTTLDTTSYYIGAVRYGNPDALTNILNLNGTQESTNNSSQNFISYPTQIGTHGGTSYLDGKIAEAIVYDRALSDSEIDDVECYLSEKWGIAVSHNCNTPILTTPKIVINEIEYDSIQSGTDSAYEWIELKNTGTGNLNLHNWTLGDDDGGGTFTFPQHTIIYAGQTLLVANNTSSFQTNYSSITPDVDTGNVLSLANTGEPITLANASGAIIDYMAFEGGDVAWTTLGANPGESVCRKDVADTDTLVDWQVCQMPTPGAQNVFNQAPTNITLSGTTLDENTLIGTLIGTFSTTDADLTDTHTYSFVTGSGDTDNNSFTLSGAILLSNFTPDFETKNSYSIRIQTNDGNTGTFQKQFTITVIDLDEITPVIILNGSGSISQEALLPYTDAGAIWTDNVDGSGALTASGNVLTNILGTYPLYYDYTDSSGNIALQVVRNVTITSPTCNPGREVFTGTGGVVSCQACQEGYYNASAGGTCIPADAGYYVPNVESNVQLACPSGTFTDTTGNNICTTCPSGYTSGTGATSCNDVEIPVITLIGSGSVDIEYGSTYTDAGAIWTDNAIGNNSGSLVASGSVDTNTLGIYTLTYNYTDVAGNAATQVSRTVNVIDTTLPIITLIGSGSIDVELGSSYTDNGATASDTYDGDITGNIVSTGSVNTTQTGSYLITFDVTDSNANTAVQVTRTVNVIDTIVPSGILDDDIDVGPVQSDRFAITPNDFAGIQVVYFGNSMDASCDINDNYTIPIVGTGSLYIETSDESLNGKYACAKIIDKNGNISYTVSSNPYNIDATAPVISSYNAPNIIRELNTSVDLLDGIVATDNIDDDIALTSNIQSSGSVDTSAEGVYTLTYAVSDTAGNVATPFTRTISIYSTTLDSDGDGVPNLYEAVAETDMNDSTDYLDTDNDGVSDYEERNGFNNGDGDGDGISDNIQQNVSGSQNPVTGETSTLKTSGNCTFITENAFVAESSLVVQDPTAEYPVGLVDFQVQCTNPGESSDVMIYYTKLYDTSNWRYKKYDGSGNVYADITSLATFGTATVGGTPVTTVSFTVTDGDPFTDEDGVADGVINDPSGPAIVVNTTNSTGGGSSGTIRKMDVCNDNGGDFSGSYYDGVCERNLDIVEDKEVVIAEEGGKEVQEQVDETETQKDIEIPEITIENNFQSCDMVSKIQTLENNENFLENLSLIGLINGYENGDFGGENDITRAEFLKVVLKAHCFDYTSIKTGDVEFIDVDISSWQARVIAKALALEMINGDKDEAGNLIFRPNDVISKIEALKILLKISLIQAGEIQETNYKDIETDWQKKYVENAQALGLFSAVDDVYLFYPNNGVERQNMFDLLHRLVQLY